MRQFLLILAIVVAVCQDAEAASGPGLLSKGISARGASSFIPPEPGAWTNEWYVATNGIVGNSGTNINEPKPIDWVWSKPAPSEVQPGDTVWFLPGWYEGGAGGPDPGGGRSRWTNMISGTPALPVTFRNWENQRVTLHIYTNQGAIRSFGKWCRFWGFEFTCTNHIGVIDPGLDQNIGLRPNAYGARGFSNWVINCIFHRMGDVIGQNNSISSTGETYYGNVFNYNGWQYYNDGGSGTGYPMYVRNDKLFKGGPTVIKHNLFGPSFDFHVHSYGTDGTNADMHAIENAFWLAGNCSSNSRTRGSWLTAVAGPTSNFVFGANAFFMEHTNVYESVLVKHGQTEFVFDAPDKGHGPNVNTVFTNNWFVGGTVNTWRAETNHLFTNNVLAHRRGMALVGGHSNGPPGIRLNVTRDRNRFLSHDTDTSTRFTYRPGAGSAGATDFNFANWKSTFGYDVNSTWEVIPPQITNSWVWKNEYEPNRAHVFIINENTNGTRHVNNFEVDVSSVFANGAVVNVRNVIYFYQKEDLGAPHAVRTVASGKITIPMTNMVMQPATTLSQTSGNFPFRVVNAGTNGSVGGFVLTTW